MDLTELKRLFLTSLEANFEILIKKVKSIDVFDLIFVSLKERYWLCLEFAMLAACEPSCQNPRVTNVSQAEIQEKVHSSHSLLKALVGSELIVLEGQIRTRSFSF